MKIGYTVLACLLAISVFASTPERKKTITLLYEVNPQDRLTIHNRFGQVNVRLWKKPEIQITIHVKAQASTGQTMDQFLNSVAIDEKRQAEQIAISTVFQPIDRGNEVATNNRDSSNHSSLQVDYTILMPATNELNITNQFGDTRIPVFTAPLIVSLNYGSFYAKSLQNDGVVIHVAYGNAEIKKMGNGRVEVAYGSLAVKSARAINLTHKWGKLKIGNSDQLTLSSSYSDTDIGVIRQSALLTISFVKQLQIKRLSETLTNLDLAVDHSSVLLPIDRQANYQFTVNLIDGQFRYPTDNSNIVLSSTATTQTESKYSGSVGKGSGPSVLLIGNYSTIDFKE